MLHICIVASVKRILKRKNSQHFGFLLLRCHPGFKERINANNIRRRQEKKKKAGSWENTKQNWILSKEMPVLTQKRLLVEWLPVKCLILILALFESTNYSFYNHILFILFVLCHSCEVYPTHNSSLVFSCMEKSLRTNGK